MHTGFSLFSLFSLLSFVFPHRYARDASFVNITDCNQNQNLPKRGDLRTEKSSYPAAWKTAAGLYKTVLVGLPYLLTTIARQAKERRR